jgi:hypothetical protein
MTAIYHTNISSPGSIKDKEYVALGDVALFGLRQSRILLC